MKLIAVPARSMRLLALFCLFFLSFLSACSPLQPAVRATVYDFGPGALKQTAASASTSLSPLVLGEIQTSGALDGSAVLYRLAYSDPLQPRPYAQARWSKPPGQLLRQRLSEQLGMHRTVLRAGQGVLTTAPAIGLHVELDEFSQLFETPDKSSGLVRARVTLGRWMAGGSEQFLAQRTFVVQHPSASADAAGGVHALNQACDALIGEILQWLQQVDADLGQSRL
ncbi:MAG: membrane integrity-associated transporter subunit PqiC [Rhodoferax sp.]|nr:membrane integrity-associated transporter subunit PqiC [Rhodoferax sp.]